MISSASTAIICAMIATVAVIQSVLYLGTWYGFACLFLALGFGVAAGILWRSEA